MAKINGPSTVSAALSIEAGAQGYWIRGIEIAPAATVPSMVALVMLDAQATDSASIPRRIVFEQMFVHGRSSSELVRCIHLGSADAAIIDSWLSDCHASNRDSQGILVTTSNGPILIRNCYIEGAGQNIMVGGDVPTTSRGLPRDIEIVGNHLRKPMEWQQKSWSVKNLLEIKTGERIDIRENYLENNWVSSQNGFGVLLRAADQETASWVKTNNVTFRHNVVTNSASGISISADGGPNPLNRVSVIGNFVDYIAAPGLGTGLRMLQLFGLLSQVEIRSNTLMFGSYGTTEGVAMMLIDRGGGNISVSENILDGGGYGVVAVGTTPGLPSLQAYGTIEFKNNAITAEPYRQYDSSNLKLPQHQDKFGYSSIPNRNFSLMPLSPLRSVPDWGAPAAVLSSALRVRSP